jgi:hypothetical protein
LIDEQTWIAAFEKTGGRPGRPSRGACRVLSSTRQTGRDPRFLTASFQADQFVVRERAGLGSLLLPV